MPFTTAAAASTWRGRRAFTSSTSGRGRSWCSCRWSRCARPRRSGQPAEIIQLLAHDRGERRQRIGVDVEPRLQPQDAPVVTAHETEEAALVEAVAQQEADGRAAGQLVHAEVLE